MCEIRRKVLTLLVDCGIIVATGEGMKREQVIRVRVDDHEKEVAIYVAKRLGLRISDTIRFVLWDWYQRLKRDD